MERKRSFRKSSKVPDNSGGNRFQLKDEYFEKRSLLKVNSFPTENSRKNW